MLDNRGKWTGGLKENGFTEESTKYKACQRKRKDHYAMLKIFPSTKKRDDSVSPLRHFMLCTCMYIVIKDFNSLTDEVI